MKAVPIFLSLCLCVVVPFSLADDPAPEYFSLRPEVEVEALVPN